MSDPVPEPEADLSYAEKIAELADRAQANNVESVPANSKWRPPRLAFDPLAPKPIRSLEVSEDQAKGLAMTRRKRFSEFWGGAWIASIPGTWGTVSQIDWHQIVLPTGGHIIELLLFLVTGTLFFASLLDFSEPTSEELFRELFPQMAKRTTPPSKFGALLSGIAKALREFPIPPL